MIARFKERAAAVRKRPLPPVAGEERQQFIAQANTDFQDFAMIGDAETTLQILNRESLRVQLAAEFARGILTQTYYALRRTRARSPAA
jgi:hypothetical protein